MVTNRQEYQREYMRDWRKDNPKYCARQVDLTREFRGKWRNFQNYADDAEVWKAAEKKSVDILAENGFSDIYLVSEDCERMPFDALARKDGVNYAIDVSVDWCKSFKKNGRKLAEWLGLTPLVLIVKPDLSDYRFRPAGIERNRMVV